MKLFNTFVYTILVCNSPVWSPHLVKDIDQCHSVMLSRHKCPRPSQDIRVRERDQDKIFNIFRDKARQNTKVFKARQGKARQGKARQGKARQGKARQGKARQGKARQGKARQGKARQGKARQGKARQGKARQDT